MLNCNGQLLSLDTAKVMGILNLTPDSFSDGGKYNQEKAALERVEEMLVQGADIIDIGGYSSRPGAAHVSEEEELERIYKITKSVLQHFPNVIISIDTFRAGIAKKVLDLGVGMINDISGGGFDADMMRVVSSYNVPFIIMHIKDTPQNMQISPFYENIIAELWGYLTEKISFAQVLGIKDIVIDLGFGFGKTLAHNYQLINHLSTFQLLDKPILVGISRKSMIYKPLALQANEILPYTTALHLKCLENGAKILRVHDVQEAKNIIKLFEIMKQSQVNFF